MKMQKEAIMEMKNIQEEDGIEILLKPPHISWAQITELLHLGYGDLKEKGQQFAATAQSIEKTKERVGDGFCLVALYKGKLVGTESFTVIYAKDLKMKRWYHDDRFYYLHSLTVHPDYKRMGIGKKLRNVIKEEAVRNQIPSLVSDTSEHVTWLIDWYGRLGHEKVGCTSHPGTNYYSVVMRTPIAGRRFSRPYRFLMYNLTVFITKLLIKENGEMRALGKWGKNLYLRLFRKPQ